MQTVSKKRVLIVVTSVSELNLSDPWGLRPGKPQSIASGWSLPTVAMSYILLRDYGFEVDICSTMGGQTIIDPATFSFHTDIICHEALQDRTFQYLINRTRPIRDFDGRQTHAILFAGGYGCMLDFASSPFICRVGRECYESGGVLAAIAHGTIALGNIKLSDGTFLIHEKSITGPSNEEEMRDGKSIYFLKHTPNSGSTTVEDILIMRGANYKKGTIDAPFVVSCDRIITGQNVVSTPRVIDELYRTIQA